MRLFLEIDKMTARANVRSSQSSEGMHDLPLKKISRKMSCLKCYKGGDVLVCNYGGCPVVIHESCMSVTARLDDNGCFCCPRCVYKQSLVECHQAKEKVLLAKNAIFCFLDTKSIKNIGNLQNSSKRKRPVSPTSMQNKNNAMRTKVETNKGVCQSMPVEGGQQDDSLECQTLADDELAAGAPESSCCLGRGTAANVFETLTKKPQKNLDTRGACQYQSNWKNEQTQEEPPQKTFGCLATMDPATDVHEESMKGNSGSIHDDCFTSQSINPDNVKEPAKIREDHRSGAEEGLQNAAHPTGDDKVLVNHEESINLTENHQDNLKAEEGLDKEGVGKTNQQSNPQGTSSCFVRKDDIIKTHEQYNKGKDATFQHDCSARKIAADSETADQPADVGEGHCGYQGEMPIKFPQNASNIMKDIVPMTNVELRDSTIKLHRIAKTVEGLHNGGGDEKQLLEPQESSVLLKTKENSTDLHETSDEADDSTCEDDCYAASQIAVNTENDDHLTQHREDHPLTNDGQTQVKASKNALHLMRKNYESMTHEESGDLFKVNHGTGEEAERYQYVVEEHSRLEIQCNLTTNDDATRMHEVSDEGNDSVLQDGYFVRNQMAVNSANDNQSAENGDSSRRTNEGNDVKDTLPIKDVSCVKDTLSADEESDRGDDSVSTGDSCCMGHGAGSKGKSKMPENVKKYDEREGLSESSENELSEFEEDEEVTHGKSGQNMDPVRQTHRAALSSARRRKLPWTVEEVEMLKEGVQKFSSTAKKNLPWMKILEFGRHAFDGTRTPVDLKDKWRNL